MNAPTRTVLFLALACIVVYVVLSILSALRMWFVHGKYVHIEFNSQHWKTFGKWAPQRLRTLVLWRRMAAAGVLLAIADVAAMILLP